MECEWEHFCRQPVKYLVDNIAAAQKCAKDQCKCNMWHATAAESEEPIMDVWQRSDVNQHFQKSRQQDAQIFTCCMRVVQTGFQSLLTFSGEQGIYVELRLQDGRSEDLEYQTVWLTKQSLLEARASKAILGVKASLASVHAKYGVKVPAQHAAEIHFKLKPHGPFFAGPRQPHRAGPFP